MPQTDRIRQTPRVWDFLEPAMVPEFARTDHVALKKPSAGNVIAYRKGQIVMQKDDGTNEFAVAGTSGYTGPARILKYSTLVNEFGQYQLTDNAAWTFGRPPSGEGSIDAYFRGYFKTQDLTGNSATNEVQYETLNGAVDGGTRVLTFGGHSTSALAWNANEAAIQAALELLPNVAAGDIVVEDSAAPIYSYTFAQAYAGQHVPLIVVDDTLLTITAVPVTPGTGSVISEHTAGSSLISGVGKLVRGTLVAGIMELGAATPV